MLRAGRTLVAIGVTLAAGCFSFDLPADADGGLDADTQRDVGTERDASTGDASTLDSGNDAGVLMDSGSASCGCSAAGDTLFEDDFEGRALGPLSGGGWTTGLGDWRVEDETDGRVLRQRASSQAFYQNLAAFGETSWEDIRLNTSFSLPRDGATYMPQLWLNRTSSETYGNGYLLYLHEGVFRLVIYDALFADAGNFDDRIVQATPIPLTPGTWYRLHFEATNVADGVRLSASIHEVGQPCPGEPILTFTDRASTYTSGFVALGCDDEADIGYDDVLVCQL